jgi:pimeloyl-ACP methyl ester carboxylesterase
MADQIATKTIPTNDGRMLAYVEVGHAAGPLVIHNHGGPSSRLEALLFAEAAANFGLRFVGVDRPGIGQSTAQTARSYKGWADDMTRIANALGYTEFGVTGWSEGGPWALAAAAYIDPTRLKHVTSIAGGSYGAFGDNSAAKYLSKADALGGFLAMHFEPGFRLMYAALGLTAEHFRKSFYKELLKAVNPYDRHVLLQPGFEEGFCASCAECFAQGSDGLVRDSELLYRRWAFDVTTIDRPVHMWQGLADTLVPAPINKDITDRMRGAIWHPVENAGHFVAIGAVNEILGIVARDLPLTHHSQPI